MKRILVLTATLALCVGCRAQVPSNPTVYICPPSSGSAYTPLNQAAPATGTSYTDAAVTPGQWCYVAQSVLGSNTSVASNTAGPLAVPSGDNVAVTWTVPATGPTPTGYIVSRAAAIQSTLAAPTLNANPTVSELTPVPQVRARTSPVEMPINTTVQLVARR